ncbi:hypothetical protein SDC9_197561 [bioreactor metagenome]|uniref:2-oxoglutarate synthase n=1 Tax=bioreactor metagenome TaxID=1076179 RepID=A0A645IF72_9ZZZZ
MDAITQCPIGFGRKNKMGTAEKMMQWQKDHAVFAQAAAKLPAEELEGKFIIGELHHSPAPEYTAEYEKLVARLQQQKGGQA